MSLEKNIVANYVGQIYVTMVGIVMLPLYIKYMGVEAYGLIGFFTMLQACFVLLDMGLTPTIGRETARFRGGAMPALEYRQLYRALSSIFFAIAVVGGGGLFLLSEFIASNWLNVEALQIDEVRLAVEIMSASVAMRWMCGLYRGVITGSERLIWLSSFSVLVATLRFILVLPVMWYFGCTPFVFFVYQFLVALVEIIGLASKSCQLLPADRYLSGAIGWSFKPIRLVLKFALTIAFTSSVWVMVTQADKLVLSGILRLDEYGYFSLAVLVASGIMVISGPVSSAIMPRMARLHAEGKYDELTRVYRGSTQLVSIIAGSAAITLACCAEQLLFAWTGDLQLAAKVAPILRLYAVGNGFLAIAAFPYYLQYAKGDLRYHLIGNLGMVVVLVPCMVLAAIYFGGAGAGYVWLVSNGLFLLVWVAYVHYKLEPGLHVKWLSKDVLLIILPTMIFAGFLKMPNLELTTRLENFIYVVAVGVILVGGALFLSDVARGWLVSYFYRRRSVR
ncbi:lipopolysaccharide biosynthesis protein [Phytopseudomonas punonensis]|uniref:Membrane protein involved in the export of O-antigen and teichoic acid n=1 Tax=Phytopseudomonas punonensis TaxID=1220495 RepID=A0A1M7M4B1_9GAMM|nr:oligosaccharide flippase family protein [Pseudomonas punonensis]SHM85050.1 Membrane protein involved in the export of O-antigen and teichoic acid [Pseudomonas punonensis]